MPTAPGAAAAGESALRQPLFRTIWLASLGAHTGLALFETGAAWLMLELAPDPLLVALVQAGLAAPVLLLAVPAGALADILDRRLVLRVAAAWLAAVAVTVSGVVIAGALSPPILLLLVVGMGAGSALLGPAFAAVAPSLVPRAALASAVTLNGVGINVGRTIGPALAGLLLANGAPALVFAATAAGYGALAAAIHAWRPAPRVAALPAGPPGAALRAGLRFARHHDPLRRVLVRAVAFFAFASATWALLAIVAARWADTVPGALGYLLAALGSGALLAATCLPALRARLGRDHLVTGAAFIVAAAATLLVVAPSLATGAVATMLFGVGWLTAVSSLQAAAQLVLPDWVRSRGMAVFLATQMGSVALGSAAWGLVARALGTDTALLLAAAGAVLAGFAARGWSLADGADLDLTPSRHWPAPGSGAPAALDRGPVLVTVTYTVAAGSRERFLELAGELGERRRRDGASLWLLADAVEHPGELTEYFLVESWLEHLHQHDRVTGDDRQLQQRLAACLAPDTAPRIRHAIAALPRERAA